MDAGLTSGAGKILVGPVVNRLKELRGKFAVRLSLAHQIMAI